MGAGVRRNKRGGFREINVTPLVDVMLVLLVVFIVTAPLMATGLKIELPRVRAQNVPAEQQRLLVTVTAEGRVLLGEEDITGRVEQAFAESEQLQTEKELYIRGDTEARYGAVARVVAAARQGGVLALNLLVNPLPPPPAQPEASPPSQ